MYYCTIIFGVFWLQTRHMIWAFKSIMYVALYWNGFPCQVCQLWVTPFVVHYVYRIYSIETEATDFLTELIVWHYSSVFCDADLNVYLCRFWLHGFYPRTYWYFYTRHYVIFKTIFIMFNTIKGTDTTKEYYIEMDHFLWHPDAIQKVRILYVS